jgi:hypothetical protein
LSRRHLLMSINTALTNIPQSSLPRDNQGENPRQSG